MTVVNASNAFAAWGAYSALRPSICSLDLGEGKGLGRGGEGRQGKEREVSRKGGERDGGEGKHFGYGLG